MFGLCPSFGSRLDDNKQKGSRGSKEGANAGNGSGGCVEMHTFSRRSRFAIDLNPPPHCAPIRGMCLYMSKGDFKLSAYPRVLAAASSPAFNTLPVPLLSPAVVPSRWHKKTLAQHTTAPLFMKHHNCWTRPQSYVCGVPGVGGA